MVANMARKSSVFIHTLKKLSFSCIGPPLITMSMSPGLPLECIQLIAEHLLAAQASRTLCSLLKTNKSMFTLVAQSCFANLSIKIKSQRKSSVDFLEASRLNDCQKNFRSPTFQSSRSLHLQLPHNPSLTICPLSDTSTSVSTSLYSFSKFEIH